MNSRMLALALTLTACGSQPAGNATTNAPAPDPFPAAQKIDCPVPGLDFTEVEFAEAEKAAFANKWTTAVDRACAEKLGDGKPFTDTNVLGPATPPAPRARSEYRLDLPQRSTEAGTHGHGGTVRHAA